MFNKRGFSYVVLLTGLMSANAWAACDYYIAPAPTGSDSSGDGSSGKPWATINFASAKLSVSSGKTTLCARGGTYYKQGGYIWHSSGTSAAPITFRNAPGEVPVFDGQWDANVGGSLIVFSNNSWIVMDGITAQHYDDQYGDGTIDLTNGKGPVHDIIIQNSNFYDNGTQAPTDHHIYIGIGAQNITIRNNLFVRTPGAAVHAFHPSSSGIKIYNNVMIGGTTKSGAQQTWGILIGDATDAQIYNNTIYGMQRGIDFNYGTTFGPGPYIVKNNLIINSLEVGLRATSSYSKYVTSDYNDFYGNKVDFNWNGSNMTLAQFASSTANDRHSLSVNPAFVSAGSNFHLVSNSPVINKGTAMASGMLATDFEGNPRNDGLVDMGAYEEAASTPVSNPSAKASAASLSFGSVNVGSSSSVQSVTITNAGGSTLTLNAPSISGDFQSASVGTCGSSLAVGASCTYSVKFAPTASGARTGVLAIVSNDPASPLDIQLSGTGVAPSGPILKAASTTLNFGSVNMGSSSSVQYVTVTNTGNATLAFSTPSYSGDFQSGNVGTCNPTLAAGASCTYSLKFVPTVSGTRTGVLAIASNDPASPLKIQLSGTGVVPLVPVAKASVTSLSFGSVNVKSSSSVEFVTITNTGNATLAFKSSSITGDFQSGNVGTCNPTLAAGASCTYSLKFVPTASGTRTGVLSIVSNDPSSPLNIQLTGVGVSAKPAVKLSVSSMSFGSVPVGVYSASQAYTITNTGTAALSFSSFVISAPFVEYGTGTAPACSTSTSLSPGQSCTMKVWFKPTSTGVKTGSVKIYSNASSSANTISLSGAGK